MIGMKKSYCLFLILLGCLACFHPGFIKAQQTYRAVKWTYKKGLPTQSSINGILQAGNGYLWFATNEGVIRFDGLHFTSFKPKNRQISANQINALFEDSRQRLWMGSNVKGFGIIHGDSTNYFSEPGYVKEFAEYPKGTLWIGTNGSGLWKINLKSDNPSPVRMFKKRFRFVNDLFVSPQGKLYIAAENGLFILNGDSLAIQTDTKHKRILSVWAGKNGKLWYGAAGGLFVSNGHKTTRINFIHSPQNPSILDIVETPSQQLLILTVRTLYTIRNHYLAPVYKAGQQKFSSMGVDFEGNIWLGTANHGLIQLIPTKIYIIGTKNGLPAALTSSITQAQDGTIYAATENGLAIFKQHSTKAQTRFKGSTVVSVLADHRNRVWVSLAFNGIRLIKNNRVHSFKKLKGTTFWVIYEDRNGRIWAGGQKGVFIYNRKKGWQAVKDINRQLSNSDVRVIRRTSSGTLWVGTSYGLDVFYADSVKVYTTDQGLRSAIIMDVAESPKGTIWIGTKSGGLHRFRNGKIKQVPVSLIGSTVYRIIPVDSTLWFSSDKGITAVDISALNKWLDHGGQIPPVIHFDRSHGLKGELFGTVQPSGWLMQNGDLWFPTVAGAAVIPANIQQKAKQAPPIIINYLTVGSDTLGTTNNIRVPHNRDRISINYTGFSFSHPKAVTYAYRLKGFDEHWNDVGNRRTAIYTNLPPGKYQFTVKTRIGNGPYSVKPASIPIIIVPAFYQTLWFKFLAACLVILIVWGGYRYRMGNIRKLQQLRVDIASDLHDEIGSNLGSIALRSKMLSKNASLSEQVQHNLIEIDRISRQTAASMRDIIWLINPEKGQIIDLKDKLKQTAAQLLVDLDFNFTMAGSNKKEISLEIRRNILAVYKEILHNIEKHAQTSKVEIKAEVNEKKIIITLKDNGIGFDQSRVGTDGIGLQSMQRRTESMKGKLNIETAPGCGTSIQLSVPIT
jgi:ligand-binding sensor domain-containing protein/two-component sensor histidine kinase